MQLHPKMHSKISCQTNRLTDGLTDWPLFEFIKDRTSFFFLTDEHCSKVNISCNTISDWLAVFPLAANLANQHTLKKKNELHYCML